MRSHLDVLGSKRVWRILAALVSGEMTSYKLRYYHCNMSNKDLQKVLRELEEVGLVRTASIPAPTPGNKLLLQPNRLKRIYTLNHDNAATVHLENFLRAFCNPHLTRESVRSSRIGN
ncbi:MAG: hypothetical protein WCC94_03645 [Candidatus Bathyarchaeia archaeon]